MTLQNVTLLNATTDLTNFDELLNVAIPYVTRLLHNVVLLRDVRLFNITSERLVEPTTLSVLHNVTLLWTNNVPKTLTLLWNNAEFALRLLQNVALLLTIKLSVTIVPWFCIPNVLMLLQNVALLNIIKFPLIILFPR